MNIGCWPSYLLVALAAVGCGTDGPKLVKVTGNVTVAGSEPFQNGLVRFVPTAGTRTTGASAITDDDGNFVLKHTSTRLGIEPGEYTVMLSLFKMPDGSELPDQTDSEEPKTPVELGGVEYVPVEYSRYDSKKFPITVTSDGGSFEFDIPELKPQKKSSITQTSGQQSAGSRRRQSTE